MPDLELEHAAGGMVAGVDEAGRGPLAGPVVAAAAVIDEARLALTLRDRIDDSKKLSAPKREAAYAELAGCARLAVGAASVAEIDRFNILGATMLAMQRAVTALPVMPDSVLVDGNRVPDLPIRADAIVNGDGLVLSIAAASIYAKVSRDRCLSELGQECPGYGWERNAGYGTRQHRDALGRLGATRHHRKSFAPIRKLVEETATYR